MERLTEKYNGKNIVKSGHITMVFNNETGNRFEGEAVDKLSAYEDAEEQADRSRSQAGRNGRCGMKREKAIKDLDIIRFNPHWDELVNEEYWEELMEMAITALQNQPVWIPVSERLPEESLNSVIGWDTYRNRCCFVQYLGGRFVLGDDIDSVNVIAWMPLPEPYRESEEENGK